MEPDEALKATTPVQSKTARGYCYGYDFAGERKRGEKRVKHRSLIQKLLVILMAQTLMVTAVFAFFCLLGIRDTRRERQLLADKLLRVSCAQLNAALRSAETTLQSVVLTREDELELLQSEQESTRFHAGSAIQNTLLAAIRGDEHVDFISVCDRDYGQAFFAQKNGMALQKREMLVDFTRALLIHGQDRGWQAAFLDGEAWLYRHYSHNGHIAAAFLNAESFLTEHADTESREFAWLLSDAGGTELARCGMETDTAQRGRLTRTVTLADGQLSLTAVEAQSSLLRQVRGSVFLMAGLLLVLVVFSLVLLRYACREIVQPLRAMTTQLQQMDGEGGDLRLRTETGSAEFSILTDSFNRLLADNLSLRLRAYRRRIETQDTQLRCIRLQLRPHFFLNAMTTISSLAMQGKDEEIRRYIEALSRNIRYMFRSGLHTVPLSEELLNVGYYLEMQELKYPDTVFYMLQKEPGLDDWPVPQMLLLTVLENEYKHAVSPDGTLSILVNIYTEEQDGEKLLCVELEDDGRGYPAELLGEMNRARSADGTRVGLCSLGQMLRIMYDREGLMRLCNIEPHGAKTRFLIPAAPVTEYREAE